MQDFFEKPNDNIESILQNEMDFYREILERRQNYNENCRTIWRNETVTERKKRLSDEIYERYSGIVSRGPFKGMQLLNKLPREHPDFGSLLLGFYEYHVTEFITSNYFKNLKLFVDIGASEGYFPIGMLYGGFAEKAIAYEDCEKSTEVMLRQANTNGVQNRLTIKGRATQDFICDLQTQNVNDTVLLCDIAGGEFGLFSDEVLFGLRKSTVIVEIHDWFDENFIDLYSRLLRTAHQFFEINFLKSKTRPIEEIYDLRSFTDDNRLLLCSEHRPSRMRYLVLTPKTENSIYGK